MTIRWCARDPRLTAPPVSEDLAGWEIERSRPGRLNARREHDGRTFFLKWFFHGPWRRPARAEWRGAAVVAALGIPTVAAAGWGVHRRGSFIVLVGAGGFAASLWRARGIGSGALARLAPRLAHHAAALHDAGLCHRDFNVYHVLIDGETLRLIDVGRVASLGRLRPRRWIVKDLASLRYSARREGLPEWLSRRFLRAYLGATRRPWRRRSLLAAVLAKAERYRRHNLKKERRGLVP